MSSLQLLQRLSLQESRILCLDFTEDGIPDSFFEDVSDITIVACGTAMYAGMIGKTHDSRTDFSIPVTVADRIRVQI